MPQSHTSSVFYGEDGPTLYPALTMAQQDAVVALCERDDEFCYCSGTFVSPRVVLTAGHCIDRQDATLQAGDIEIHVGDNTSMAKAVLTVSEVHYRNWKTNPLNDVAVAIVATPSSVVDPLPIKLGGVSSILLNDAQVVGFGITEISEYNVLRRWTTMRVEDVSSAQIAVNGSGETGVAPGDSGGPLIYDFGSGPQVAGVASTSQDGWVDWATYTSMEAQADWVQTYVDLHDGQCTGACEGIGCGMHDGCMCGSCPRGFECRDGSCEEIAGGYGGACATLSPGGIACERSTDCPDDAYCVVYETGNSECAEHCAPSACAPYDGESFCMPVSTAGGGFVSLCFESANTPCGSLGEICTTTDGRHGYCLDMYSDGNTGCYGLCETVETCPSATGCLPGQFCGEVCRDLECGEVRGCECGTCPLGESCIESSCELGCQPSCSGRECGSDGCGASCGSCPPGRYCSASATCLLGSDPTGATGMSPIVGRSCAAFAPSPGFSVALCVALCWWLFWRRRAATQPDAPRADVSASS